MSERAKKLTNKMLNGIIAATSNVLAGPEDGECEEDWDDIEAVDQWARGERSRRERISEKRGKKTKGTSK